MNHRLTKQNLQELSGPEGLRAKLSAPNKVRKKRADPEGAIQRQFIKWWDNAFVGFGIPHRMLFSIPNGAVLGHGKEEYQVKHRQIRGRMLKLAGLRSGVPDLFLSVARQGWHGCYIELKDTKGVTSQDQIQVGKELLEQRYQVSVCRSLDEAIKTITDYLT